MDEFSIMRMSGSKADGEDSDAESFASALEAEEEEQQHASSSVPTTSSAAAHDRKDPVGSYTASPKPQTGTHAGADAASSPSLVSRPDHQVHDSTPTTSQPEPHAESSSPVETQADATGTAQSTTRGHDATEAATTSAAAAIQADGQVVQAEEAAEQPQPELSAEEQQVMLDKAEALKAEGNTLYAQGQYEEAVSKYAQAVDAAPPPPYAKHERAVYLANMAAAEIGLKHWAEAASAASDALDEEPGYVKALMRRAMALEQLDQLDQALADAKKVVEVDARNAWGVAAVARMEPQVTERHEKLKDEMLGKMKELGNMVLGKFGMSVDNFKAVKDPATGSYSISFQQ